MSSFIKVVEVWVPGEDGTLLELSDGLFGAAYHFEALTRSMCFGRGEGLPGRAWDEGRPLMLDAFEGSYFRRTAAARTAGLGAAVAMPVFRSNMLVALTVVFCGGPAQEAGSIDIQRDADPAATDPTSDLVIPCVTSQGGTDLVRFRPKSGTSLAAGVDRLAPERPGAFAGVFERGVPEVSGASVGLPIVRGGQVVEVLALSL